MFLFAGQLCTIYVGVSPEGRVRGVQISRKERDQLGVAIDCIMHNSFSPAIKHHCYKVVTVMITSHRLDLSEWTLVNSNSVKTSPIYTVHCWHG